MMESDDDSGDDQTFLPSKKDLKEAEVSNVFISKSTKLGTWN